MMHANPSLIAQAMFFTSKGQSVYYSTWGWFLKIFKWRIFFHLTIIHYIFIHFHRNIVNKLFWENWVKFKIQILPIHVYSESVSSIFDAWTIWIKQTDKLTNTNTYVGLLIGYENDRWTIVFCFIFKTTHTFWTFRKGISIVFENDCFH